MNGSLSVPNGPGELTDKDLLLRLAQNSPLRWTSWGYVPQSVLARYYTITLLLVCTLPYAKKIKPYSPSLSTHSTPAAFTTGQDSDANAERRLTAGGIAELENDLVRRHGLAHRERRAKVEAGLASPESVLGFQVVHYPHVQPRRDYDQEDLEAGDYWMDLERQRQKEHKANDRRLLDIAMRVPKAAPTTDKRNKDSSHGWYSLEPK